MVLLLAMEVLTWPGVMMVGKTLFATSKHK